MEDVKCAECIAKSDARLAALSQSILRATDPYTAHHHERVAKIAMAIGQHVGCSAYDLQILYYAGVVHDLGKVAVPTEILNKPFRLVPQEFELIKTHVSHSVEILRSVGFCEAIAEVVACHHERLDGSGYPLGLDESKISRTARILTIADVFESMTSHRPYRPSLGTQAAIEELRAGMHTHYDAGLVESVIDIVSTTDFNQTFGIGD